MTTELYWLTLTVLMTALLVFPYILDRIFTTGLWAALSQPKPEAGIQSAWADRAMKAHTNAIENLAIFAPAVLVAHALNITTPGTQFAAKAYFFARLVHYVVYTLGTPVLRTLAYVAGLLATLQFVLAILQRA